MKMLQVFSKEDLSHFEKRELEVLCPTHDVVRVDRTFLTRFVPLLDHFSPFMNVSH